MRKKITLSIPEPCQEDWSAMSISGNGRHCDSCKTVVRDFSKFTDQELHSVFRKEAISCGKFRIDQLDKALIPASSHLTPTFNLKAIALGIGILITTTSFAYDTAQETRSFDLIEMVQNGSTIPADTSINTDSLVYFIIQKAGSLTPIEGADIYFVDADSNIVLELKTASNGMVSYERLKLEALNLRKIIIKSGFTFQAQEMKWEDDNDGMNVIALENKEEVFFMGIVIRE